MRVSSLYFFVYFISDIAELAPVIPQPTRKTDGRVTHDATQK